MASSLVNLVRDSDNRDGIMKQVAAGGFKDITRIASSSPEMWEQICMANREPIIQVLSQYIRSLSQILSQIQDSSQTELLELFASSREYRDSITDRAKGALTPEYSFSVDIVDEAGAISTLSVILAAKGINIKNIGINNNREQGTALRMARLNGRQTLSAIVQPAESAVRCDFANGAAERTADFNLKPTERSCHEIYESPLPERGNYHTRR